MATFVDMVYMLQDIGVADVLLPFILVFTVVFAILQKSKILGKDSKKFNVILALVMGASIIFPHVLGYYPPYADPVMIINASLPSISVVVIAIIMVMLLLGIFGSEFNLESKGINGTILFISLATVIYVFGTNAGFFGNGNFPPWLWFLADPNTQSLLVMILVFGAIIYFITKEDKDEKEKDKPSWIKAIESSKKGD